MRVVGEWQTGDDGVSRPVVKAGLLGSDGQLHLDYFLIDSGADRTAFSAGFLDELQLLTHEPAPGFALRGISGRQGCVFVHAVLEFTSDDGRMVRVHGEFAAFTDPSASDQSILGRDVLNNFDVIISKPRDEIQFLSPNHQYVVTRA